MASAEFRSDDGTCHDLGIVTGWSMTTESGLTYSSRPKRIDKTEKEKQKALRAFYRRQ